MSFKNKKRVAEFICSTPVRTLPVDSRSSSPPRRQRSRRSTRNWAATTIGRGSSRVEVEVE